MSAPSCPDPRALLRLVLEQLAEPEARQLRQHLKQCAPCRAKLNALGVEGTHFRVSLATEETAEKPPVSPAAAPAPSAPPVSPAAADVDFGLPLSAFLKPSQAPNEIGRLGNYRVLQVLGQGAAGVVFRAEDIQLRRIVALKVMKPVDKDPAHMRERFLREGRLAASLEHEHVMTIYQVGEDDGIPYLAMQLLQGETLDERLKREQRLDVLETLRIGHEIALGLAAAHERGIVHRDLKPANVWLEARTGRVKLVDFGLARCLTDDVQLTKTGTVMGTPAYMAPEQARGDKVDHRCDLFSLGGLIYRMATGRTPFQAEDTMGMMLALAHEQPPPLQAFNDAVPDALQGLVFWLLAKHPDARPQAAAEVAEALEAIAEQVIAAQSDENAEAAPADHSWLQYAVMVLLAVGTFCVFWNWDSIVRTFHTMLRR